MEPEVRVRSIRRRRREPPPPPAPRSPNVRNWLIYAGVVTLVAALMVDGFLRHRPQRPLLPTFSQATDVRSSISESGDSLQVIVSWDLTLSDPAGRPDSIRIKVVPEPLKDSLVSIQASNQLADTLYLAAPRRGQTLSGVSCAAADHSGQPPEESCTPWQYVRPSATPVVSADYIVIKPGGLQVDPDVGGRCAAWQQNHPGGSVWIQVNRTAIPECTGPNHKPTVAQFCAFAILPGGRRVKTANSINNSYCEELFVEWSRELSS